MKKLLIKWIIRRMNNRLTHYSHSAYQLISQDWFFNNVPPTLISIWDTNFQKLAHRKELNNLTILALIRRANLEYRTIISLRKIFADLNK